MSEAALTRPSPALLGMLPSLVGLIVIGGVEAAQEASGNGTVLGAIIAGAFALAIAALPYLARRRGGRPQVREETVPKSAYDLLLERLGALEIEVAALKAELATRPPARRR